MHEATAGDFRRFGDKAVVNCTKLPRDRQLEFCQLHINTLQAKIQQRESKGQAFDSCQESLTQELNWAAQLSSTPTPQNKKLDRAPSYDSLVRDTPITQVLKLGKTKQGVFYLVYQLANGWKTCTFVSSSKILKALVFALEQQGKVGAKLQEVVAIADTQIKIRYNWQGIKSSICTTTDISPYLVEWNNSRLPAVSHSTEKLRAEIEKEVISRNLTAQFIEDEGELFSRIYCDKLLGIISVGTAGKITITTEEYREKKVHSIRGAMGLITNKLPRSRTPDSEIIAENQKFLTPGIKVCSDGTIASNYKFWELVGKVSQVRGR